MLTKDALKRYDRQIKIFGEEGQEKLKKAKVFIAGAGGLGSPISIYIAVVGIGKIRMVDDDIVELTNLNRQILHWDNDIGKKKAESAEEKLKKMNPNVEVEVISKTIDEGNIDELVSDFDMIVDAMDNFPTRYLLNKTALVKNVPFFSRSGLWILWTSYNDNPRKNCLFKVYISRGSSANNSPNTWCNPRYHWLYPSNRGDKIYPWNGELLREQAFDVGRFKCENG